MSDGYFSENEKLVYDKLKAKGFNDNAIAGIMANIDVETGGTFSPTQKQHWGGNGYGIFQLDSQKKYYKKYLKDNNATDSLDSQINYMYDTIYGNSKDVIGPGHAAKLQKVLENGPADEVAFEFMDRWENPGVPHHVRRIKSAYKYQNLINGDQEKARMDEEIMNALGAARGGQVISDMARAQTVGNPYYTNANMWDDIGSAIDNVKSWFGSAADPQPLKQYEIKAGDNLSLIAKKLNTTVDQLVTDNNITDPNKIKAGQILDY